MDGFGDHEQLSLVNSLILDVGALQGRIEDTLVRLRNVNSQESAARAKAVATFRDELLAATTRLRQGGLHPPAQGTLW
jgi:hypothetical protein